MRQLSPLDAAFLYFETPRSPMHIGGLYIFEGNSNQQQYSYQQFLNHVKSRLHIASVFTERLIDVPLNMDLPYWITDKNFDIELHCPHLGLIDPQDLTALMKMSADIFSRPLDRTRPMWEAHFIENLNNVEGVSKNAFAIIFKIHHCAVDGISGEEILASLLDITPEPRKIEIKENNKSKTARKPFQVELLAKSIRPTLQIREKILKLLLASLTMAGKSLIGRIFDKENAPPLLFQAPPTPFNDAISPHRSFSGTQLSLDEIKKIKQPFAGVTVNDVILAICAGALNKYLSEKNISLNKPLTVMVPISVRDKKQKHTMGNQVSSMLLSLASDIEDPLERLQKIHANAEAGKTFNKLTHFEQLADYVPSLLQTVLAKIYSVVRFTQKNKPAFNLVVTNVPGPQLPLYFDGTKLHSQYGMAPVIDGMGLILVVMSYNGNVGIGITACRELMPDTELFAKYLNEACHELLAAAATIKVKKPSVAGTTKAKTKSKTKADTKTKEKINTELKKAVLAKPRAKAKTKTKIILEQVSSNAQ